MEGEMTYKNICALASANPPSRMAMFVAKGIASHSRSTLSVLLVIDLENKITELNITIYTNSGSKGLKIFLS